MEERIKEKIDLIANDIYCQIQNSDDLKLGLYNGDWGILLFLFYYSRYTNNNKHIAATERYAENLINNLIKNLTSHTFCSGLSGILYLIEFLKENEFIDIDLSEIHTQLDNYIINKVKIDIPYKNYDFLHGYLGPGLYFLKKGHNTHFLNRLIYFLEKGAEKSLDNTIYKWESQLNEQGNRGHNISLSHGISSIVIFLCRCLDNNHETKDVLNMLNGGVNYILSQQIDPVSYSYFPSMSLENDPLKKGSRLAWCYGDLGVSLAIWLAGKQTNNAEWEKFAYNIFQYSTKRVSLSENAVLDAGICHGSAGIAMVFNRLYLFTNDTIFKTASKYWIERTFNFGSFPDGTGGYKSLYGNNWIQDNTLLTGAAGIGLVLLSSLTKDNQNWDEMFLLHH